MDEKTLNEVYAGKLAEVFSWVDARLPEKGIETILSRARREADEKNLPYAHMLEQHYQGVLERTQRRLRLIAQCSVLPKS